MTSAIGAAMNTKLLCLAATLWVAACASSEDEISRDGPLDCGQGASTKDLSVSDRSYDDVTGAIACKDSPIEVYDVTASVVNPGPSGLVPKPTGAPIGQTRTGGAFAELALPAGSYVVCLAHAQPSCGHVTLQGRHVYATFTGGPSISFTASEDVAIATR